MFFCILKLRSSLVGSVMDLIAFLGGVGCIAPRRNGTVLVRKDLRRPSISRVCLRSVPKEGAGVLKDGEDENKRKDAEEKDEGDMEMTDTDLDKPGFDSISDLGSVNETTLLLKLKKEMNPQDFQRVFKPNDPRIGELM